MAGRYLERLVLTQAEATELGLLAERRKTAQALALQALIILAFGERLQDKDIAASLGVHAITVGKKAAALSLTAYRWVA